MVDRPDLPFRILRIMLQCLTKVVHVCIDLLNPLVLLLILGRNAVDRRSKAFVDALLLRGSLVSIVLDGGQQKGMPHRRFQGMTGTIESKQGRAYVVSFSDKNKKKTVIARPEHLRPAE